MDGMAVLFLLLAAVAVASAILMLTSRNAVYSALWLVLNFSTIGVFYIVLNATFIAMVQITVYAGAIMVLFLFVIMLLGAERLTGVRGSELWQRITAVALTAVLLIVLGIATVQRGATEGVTPMIDASPTTLGLRLFEAYVFPFEVTGILLLVAMIGVVVLNRRNKKGGQNV